MGAEIRLRIYFLTSTSGNSYPGSLRSTLGLLPGEFQQTDSTNLGVRGGGEAHLWSVSSLPDAAGQELKNAHFSAKAELFSGKSYNQKYLLPVDRIYQFTTVFIAQVTMTPRGRKSPHTERLSARCLEMADRQTCLLGAGHSAEPFGRDKEELKPHDQNNPSTARSQGSVRHKVVSGTRLEFRKWIEFIFFFYQLALSGLEHALMFINLIPC